MKICLLEMDERTLLSLTLIISNCDPSIAVLSAEADAEIVIVDLDREDSLKKFHTIHQFRPDLRAIGLASNDEWSCDNMLVMVKPVSVSRLISAVKQVWSNNTQAPKLDTAIDAATLGARVGHLQRPRGISASTAPGKLHFDQDSYLLGALLHALHESKQRDLVSIVSVFGDRVILIDHKSNLVRTNLTQVEIRVFAHSDAHVFAHAIAPSERESKPSGTSAKEVITVDYLTREKAASNFAHKTHGTPRESFMWEVGSHASRGRLPRDMRTDERIFLRRWPNMTTINYTENAMRVIAFWAQHSASIDETATTLGIPAPEVNVVYVSAWAANLAAISRRNVDTILELPVVPKHSGRGFFSAILKRLTAHSLPVDGKKWAVHE